MTLPDSPAGRACNDGCAAAERGDVRRALAQWRRALRLDPTCVEALYNLATVVANPKQALDHARRAVEISGGAPMSYYVLARALLCQGFKLPALRALREFLSRADLTDEESSPLLAAASQMTERLQLDVLIST